MKRVGKTFGPAVFLTWTLCLATGARGYSVLTHEAIVDTLWDSVIRPMLLKRYPTATEEQLRQAHAYAYGGCIIQDMGYYPFGSRFFSDLTHYVRSGDFIEELLRESQDLNEYAFALGALAHYAADNSGHPLAVNRSVPLIYPKLGAKYGKEVTFEQDPKAHVLVEFAFDVVQVAGAGYQPETYSNFVGFQVSKPLLDRAFKTTYGLDLRDLFINEDLAIGTYRRGASEIIPQMTVLAWRKRKAEIMKLRPGIRRREFVYKLSRAHYEAAYGPDYNPHVNRELRRYSSSRIFGKVWGEGEAKPGLLTRFLVFMFRIFPKVGRFQTLSFKVPTPETEAFFNQSLNVTLDRYRRLLAEVSQTPSALQNEDCDTGSPTRAGEYRLADETYSELLDKLAENKFAKVTPELRSNILAFYGDLSAPIATKKDKDHWQKTVRELDNLRASAGETTFAGRD